MSIVTIAAKKGGNGKTTTSIHLAAGLSAYKKKVLLVDVDSQCNLSTSVGAYDTSLVTIHDVLNGDCGMADAIQSIGSMDVVQSALDIDEIEKADWTTSGSVATRLKSALESVRAQYDYIIIDTPPAIRALTRAALAASDQVILVTQSDQFSLDSIYQMRKVVRDIRDGGNSRLEMSGILITRYSGRSNARKVFREEIADLAEKLGTKVYGTPIRENIAIVESQVVQKSVYKYKRKCNAAADYIAFVREFLSDHGDSQAIDGIAGMEFRN